MKTKNKHRYGNAHFKCVLNSPIDEFIFESNSDGSVTRVSDIDLLLHQKSIQTKLGLDTFRNWVSKLNNAKSSFDVSNYTDEQLLTFTKSRYINSFSDLDRYGKQINRDVSQLCDDIQRSLDYNSKIKKLISKSK